MISEEDKNAIVDLAAKYNVSRLLLFGSSLDLHRESNDIDLAVEGLPDEQFFEFYSELIFKVSKSVDLIDINRNPRFKELILKDSVNLYG